jgi:ribosomal protein L10
MWHTGYAPYPVVLSLVTILSSSPVVVVEQFEDVTHVEAAELRFEAGGHERMAA